MRRSVLSELREFIRSVIEENTSGLRNIFGPPNSPDWLPEKQWIGTSNTQQVVDWSATFLKEKNKKIIGRGYREGQRLEDTKKWQWNPATERELTGLDELGAAFYKGKDGAVFFGNREDLTPEENALINRYGPRNIRYDDHRGGAVNFMGPRVEKRNRRWFLRGQWEEAVASTPSQRPRAQPSSSEQGKPTVFRRTKGDDGTVSTVPATAPPRGMR